jgi:hypothetical protein
MRVLTPMMLTEWCCTMHTTTILFAVQLPAEVPFAFPLTQLARLLTTLVDRRARRGVRYPLAPLLTIAVVAKLAGQSRLEPLADWARQPAPELARVYGLNRLSMPHQTTWSRILAKAVDMNALEFDFPFDRFLGRLGLSDERPRRYTCPTPAHIADRFLPHRLVYWR